MIQATGSSAISGTTGTSTPTAGLDAQLARYGKELSECVNCESAKTPEGKEAIQAASDKISAVKTRLEEIAVAKTSSRPAPSEAKSEIGIAPVSVPGSANATVGGLLDVFA
jgi:hypothetical protein